MFQRLIITPFVVFLKFAPGITSIYWSWNLISCFFHHTCDGRMLNFLAPLIPLHAVCVDYQSWHGIVHVFLVVLLIRNIKASKLISDYRPSLINFSQFSFFHQYTVFAFFTYKRMNNCLKLLWNFGFISALHRCNNWSYNNSS